jgi:integrase-like protein
MEKARTRVGIASQKKKFRNKMMGLYRRRWRRKDGKIVLSKVWWMTAMIDGRQVCKTTGTSNKRLAQKRQDAWRTEIAQGQYSLLRKAPQLKDWADKYLESIELPNTRRRYKSSEANLVTFFGDSRLDHISAKRIDEFKRVRREDGVKGATINRDLRFLAQILKQAERERYIGRSPFDLGKFFANETRERRKPYILGYEEQEKLAAGNSAAPDSCIDRTRGRNRNENWGDDRFTLGGHRSSKRRCARP